MRNNTIKNNFHDAKLAINSCLSVSKAFINKFHVLLNNEGLLDISIKHSNISVPLNPSSFKNKSANSNNNFNDILVKIEEWIKVVSFELEVNTNYSI